MASTLKDRSYCMPRAEHLAGKIGVQKTKNNSNVVHVDFAAKQAA